MSMVSAMKKFYTELKLAWPGGLRSAAAASRVEGVDREVKREKERVVVSCWMMDNDFYNHLNGLLLIS